MDRRILAAILVLFSSVWAADATTCDVDADSCTITITINIAFDSGASSDYVDRARGEIANFWNNAGGTPPTYGDCKCAVKFAVNALKNADCSKPPQGYHCIKVTPYGTTPPISTNGTKYPGYMYPPGVSTGQPLTGWWSDIMSRPTEDGSGSYFDFAHEAGHMMGLEDGDGGIMSNTSAPGAQPNQDLIDEIVRDACKGKKCPDRCCCGNGAVEKGKGEGCDPAAKPNGCGSSDSCCPYCCNCYPKQCNPADGEYASEAECKAGCTSENAGLAAGTAVSCAYNYWTGCWDCAGDLSKQISPQYDSTRIRECPKDNHSTAQSRVNGSGTNLSAYVGGVPGKMAQIPLLSSFVSNERINVYVGRNVYGLEFEGGKLKSISEGGVKNPTINMYTDEQTVYEIGYGDISVIEAIKRGKITYEGADFVSWLKIRFGGFFFDIFYPYEGPGPDDIIESVLVAP